MPDLAEPGDSLSGKLESKSEESDQAESVKKQELKSPRFGRSLFTREVSTCAPTDDAPVPNTDRLGGGDELLIQLFGKENNQFTLQIGREGNVTFPKLGSIILAGLTFEDARDLITARIAQQFIGVEAVISLGRLRAINIFMAGEVNVPGAFSVSALTTITQALFQAGGVTDIGSLRNIKVMRSGDLVATFDAYELLLRGDSSSDIRLQSGDVVFVPPYAGVVELLGEVKRPSVYEIQGHETISEVISMAGSFTENAFPQVARLTRQSESLSRPEALTIDLRDSRVDTMLVESGDTLTIPKKVEPSRIVLGYRVQ